MSNTLKKLTINDLKIGMHVSSEQLSDLYGVWIYINPKTNNDNDIEILYFCTNDTRDDSIIHKLSEKYGETSVIYQPEFYKDDAEVYDEY